MILLKIEITSLCDNNIMVVGNHIPVVIMILRKWCIIFSQTPGVIPTRSRWVCQWIIYQWWVVDPAQVKCSVEGTGFLPPSLHCHGLQFWGLCVIQTHLKPGFINMVMVFLVYYYSFGPRLLLLYPILTQLLIEIIIMFKLIKIKDSSCNNHIRQKLR